MKKDTKEIIDIENPVFERLFPTLDEMILHVHPSIEVRKVYAWLRINGLSEQETKQVLHNLIQDVRKRKSNARRDRKHTANVRTKKNTV